MEQCTAAGDEVGSDDGEEGEAVRAMVEKAKADRQAKAERQARIAHDAAAAADGVDGHGHSSGGGADLRGNVGSVRSTDECGGDAVGGNSSNSDRLQVPPDSFVSADACTFSSLGAGGGRGGGYEGAWGGLTFVVKRPRRRVRPQTFDTPSPEHKKLAHLGMLAEETSAPNREN